MEFLGNLMQEGLKYAYNLTGNYVVAIFLLTLTIRVLLFPFTRAQTLGTIKMQELDPEIKKIQKQFKDQPDKANAAQMELWKKHGVQPLNSCLLLILQFPIIIALFRALERYEPMKEAIFMGIRLGDPNKIVLPLLAAVTTYIQIKATTPTTAGNNPQNQQNQMMLIMFPLLIGWMSTRFAAALSIYWIISNLFSVAERWVVLKTRVVKGESTGQ